VRVSVSAFGVVVRGCLHALAGQYHSDNAADDSPCRPRQEHGAQDHSASFTLWRAEGEPESKRDEEPTRYAAQNESGQLDQKLS